MLKREICIRCHMALQMDVSVSLPFEGGWQAEVIWCPHGGLGGNNWSKWVNTDGEPPDRCIYRVEQLVC